MTNFSGKREPDIELNLHTPVALQRDVAHFVDFYLLDQLCLNALRSEVLAWPKPGLVSPVDSGSHHDMQFGTFLKSIAALEGTFAEMAMAAAFGEGFQAMMAAGRRAEARMVLATDGANTHRGAIFNLGLLASASALRLSNPAFTGLSCGKVVEREWGEKILTARSSSAATHGNQVYQRFARGGARGEAAAGFPMLYCFGIPTLSRLLQVGFDAERAIVGTLMELIEHVDDTNLLWRGGEDGLAFAKQSARNFNLNGGVEHPDWRGQLKVIHRSFVERNLSPGGSADLVAASWVAHHLDKG
ncbi:MAG: triphosphoribosyl-dephospho-CoA synthase [Desulfuromonadaceae bacterium]|nr:triphosphoribosyl-dephospho-CoA synthase [Desulfuromonadaceae bacterium]